MLEELPPTRSYYLELAARLLHGISTTDCCCLSVAEHDSIILIPLSHRHGNLISSARANSILQLFIHAERAASQQFAIQCLEVVEWFCWELNLDSLYQLLAVALGSVYSAVNGLHIRPQKSCLFPVTLA